MMLIIFDNTILPVLAPGIRLICQRIIISRPSLLQINYLRNSLLSICSVENEILSVTILLSSLVDLEMLN